MERHFHEQLDTLKHQLIDMAMAVEEAIASAIEALIKRDDRIAEQVIDRDEQINKMEIDIDEICLRLLALQQPMAIDLRFVTSAMKLNNDLERIGDHAVNRPAGQVTESQGSSEAVHQYSENGQNSPENGKAEYRQFYKRGYHTGQKCMRTG